MRAVSKASFERIQSLYTIPAIFQYWDKMKTDVADEMKDRSPLVVAGSRIYTVLKNLSTSSHPLITSKDDENGQISMLQSTSTLEFCLRT